MTRDETISVQSALAVIGLLDQPSDGQFGRTSRWALTEFCKAAQLPFDGVVISPEIANALAVAKPWPCTPKDDLAGCIIRAYQAHGFWFSRHPLCMNLGHIEGMSLNGSINDDAPDKWNDLRYIVQVIDGVPKITFLAEATTQPGRYWVKNRMNPKGAASIEIPSQFKAWRPGIHRGDHKAFVQRANVVVLRDDNEDFDRKGDLRDEGDGFGINIHGTHNQSKSTLGHTSAGCQVVRDMAEHLQSVTLVETDPRVRGNPNYLIINTTLPASDLVQVPPLAPSPPAALTIPVIMTTSSSVTSSSLISRAAIDLIVAEEVTSRATYDKRYRRPEWPGGASGVTIGIGYDVGAGVKDKAQLRADWKGRIPDAMIAVLEQAIGVTGDRARTLTARIKGQVDVPWDAAMAVFETVDVPRWYMICKQHLPHFDDLPPDCRGVLLSLAYNRGPSFAAAGERYREMRAIKAHMTAKTFTKIPGELRSMKRIWLGQNLDGLLKRREREAVLFERGLN